MSHQTLTRADRHALGVRARKQLARSAHCTFDRSACPHQPLDILHDSMRGRLPPLVKLKYERMAASAFGFFRGAVPIMAADLASHPHTGILTQICGDAHLLNLGAYGSSDGRLVFDVNDFDETIRGPFEWDVKRLAASILLAGRANRIARSARRKAVAIFTARYRKAMRDFAEMPILEIARYQVGRMSEIAPVAAILAASERATPERAMDKLTEPGKSMTPAMVEKAETAKREAKSHRHRGGEAANEATKQKEITPDRRFKSNPPLLERITGAEAKLVLDALIPYARTLAPERRHFLSMYRPIDVAFKVVGTGSVGLRDYCIYFEGNPSGPNHCDPLFLQIKEEPASAYGPYLPEAHTHNGHRVVDGQRAMQLTSDPFLGYTTIDGRDYLVRQLNDHKASLDLPALKAEGLLAYADLCGELFARGHARSGDPVAIAAYLGTSPRFDRAIHAFATTYADQTERDWKALVKSMKKEGSGKKGKGPAKQPSGKEQTAK